MSRRVWTALLLTLLTGVLCGDTASATPAARRDTPAGAAVRAVTADASVASGGVPGAVSGGGGASAGDGAPVPGDFEVVMGYLPVREGGVWVAPHGACSAPTGATRYDFAAACKAHDLGYDLLRYAARVGKPLGPWAREAVDAAFGRALAARCASVDGAVGCRAAAAAYHGVVVANSWRQDWRDPRPEPWLPWVLVATALTLAPIILNAVLAYVDRMSTRRGR
ncbi:phospholipase A2 [Cryptosporangium sp. NPDC048952]|uniref:phospholipase A2 n=1 Tax=Cryptosporangium sp. NPDC048952 TaxID=3363961 RepID=UPI0037220420